MIKTKKTTLATLIFATSALTAAAQDAFDGADEFGDFYSDADFISIATGSKTTLDKAPAIASVISADDMKRRGVTNLVEALSMVPGLNVSRNSQIMAPKFNFRGITSTFSPQSLVMINGVPLKSLVRGDNHVAWGQFPIHNIARIEVIRGPGSALYGADAFAGVVNVITKSASDKNPNEIGGFVGSFDSQSAWLNKNFIGKQYSVALSVDYSQSDGHREEIKQDAQFPLDVAASNLFNLPPVSLAPGPVNVGFKALDVSVKGNLERFQFNLGMQQRTDLGTGQGVGFAIDPNGKVGGSKLIVDLAYDSEEFDSGWVIKSKFSYYRSEQEIEKDLNIFPPGTFFGTFPDGFIGNPEWKEDNTSFRVKGEYKHFAKHNLSIGIGYSKADLFEVTEHKNFFPDLTPRPNGIEDVSDTEEVFIPEASRRNRYAFIQDIWQIAPDWELTSGIRWDDYSDIGTTINPRFALVWSSSLHSTTKFLYGRAFRAPSIAELLVVNNPVALGNPSLSPEIIDTYEVGYTLNVSTHSSVGVNAFYYQIDDFITFIPDELNSTSTAQNVGEREGYGVELESQTEVTQTLNITTNYSYVKSKDSLSKANVGDYPNHQFNADLNWDVSSSYFFNLNINVVGERLRRNDDPRQPLSGFTNLSTNLIYSGFGNQLELSLSAKNLLDDEIFETSPGPDPSTGAISIPNDLPQAGRSLYLSITKNF